MTVSPRELNRATLDRQLLLDRHSLPVAEAVWRVMALQAQQPASPYVALWNRIRGFDPAELDAAYEARQVVKATLLRVTLHTVHAHDYEPFRSAMEPTLRSALFDNSRFAACGLAPHEARDMIPDLVVYATQPRTSAEVEAWLEQRVGRRLGPGAWRCFRGYAPLLHAPTGGAWSFGPRPAYVSAGTPPLHPDPEAAATSLQHAVRRYLKSFGPASVPDMAQFLMVPRARVQSAVASLVEELEQLRGQDGTLLYDVPGEPRPPADAPAAPRLLPMWDSTLLAYSDRTRVVPDDLRRLVIRSNGDVLPTLLVDGQVVGVWRAVAAGIEATAFRRLPRQAWHSLRQEAEALVGFLATRDPLVYARYNHWWSKLPRADTRMLTRNQPSISS